MRRTKFLTVRKDHQNEISIRAGPVEYQVLILKKFIRASYDSAVGRLCLCLDTKSQSEGISGVGYMIQNDRVYLEVANLKPRLLEECYKAILILLSSREKNLPIQIELLDNHRATQFLCMSKYIGRFPRYKSLRRINLNFGSDSFKEELAAIFWKLIHYKEWEGISLRTNHRQEVWIPVCITDVSTEDLLLWTVKGSRSFFFLAHSLRTWEVKKITYLYCSPNENSPGFKYLRHIIALKNISLDERVFSV